MEIEIATIFNLNNKPICALKSDAVGRSHDDTTKRQKIPTTGSPTLEVLFFCVERRALELLRFLKRGRARKIS